MSVFRSRWFARVSVGLAFLLLAGFAVGQFVHDRQPASVPTAGGGDVTLQLGQGTGGEFAPAAPALGAAPRERSVTGGVKGSGDQTAAGATGAGGGSLSGIPPLGDRIIKSADLSVDVKKGTFDQAWSRAFSIAARYDGYVVSSSRGTPGPVPLPFERKSSDETPLFGDITLRVPVERFEAALNDLRRLGEVRSDMTSSQDVTEEYVDLESRLRNLRAQEAVLLKLMARSKTIEDTIIVQQQLSSIQGQIEEITGRLRYLRSQTEFSTISVHLAEPGAVAGEEPAGPSFTKAWRTALDGLERIGTAVMIGVLWIAPFAVLLAIVFGWRRRGRSSPAA